VDRGPYFFDGRIQDDFGACSLIAAKIKVLEDLDDMNGEISNKSAPLLPTGRA